MRKEHSRSGKLGGLRSLAEDTAGSGHCRWRLRCVAIMDKRTYARDGQGAEEWEQNGVTSASLGQGSQEGRGQCSSSSQQQRTTETAAQIIRTTRLRLRQSCRAWGNEQVVMPLCLSKNNQAIRIIAMFPGCSQGIRGWVVHQLHIGTTS